MKSLSEIPEKGGFTRARVTQIINLLKSPSDWKDLLLGLAEPKELRKYSERKLRTNQNSCSEPMVELPQKSRGKQKHPPETIVVEIDELLPRMNLEAQKELVVNPASGGTLPVEYPEETSQYPSF